MSLSNNLNKIIIIDFGSQFTQLIARRVRELGIFSEIVSHKKVSFKALLKQNIGGIFPNMFKKEEHDVRRYSLNTLDYINEITNYFC